MLCWCKVSSAVVEVDQIRLKSMSNMDVNAKHQLARDAVINYFDAPKNNRLLKPEIAAHFKVAQALVINRDDPVLILIDAKYSNKEGRPFYEQGLYPHCEWINIQKQGMQGIDGMQIWRSSCVLTTHIDYQQLTMYLFDETETNLYTNAIELMSLWDSDTDE
jgi:hypothetical protein